MGNYKIPSKFARKLKHDHRCKVLKNLFGSTKKAGKQAQTVRARGLSRAYRGKEAFCWLTETIQLELN
jgi:hypothetical protein